MTEIFIIIIIITGAVYRIEQIYVQGDINNKYKIYTTVQYMRILALCGRILEKIYLIQYV